MRRVRWQPARRPGRRLRTPASRGHPLRPRVAVARRAVGHVIAFGVRDAEDFLEAAVALERDEDALLAQREPALALELSAQLVRRGAQVDHAAQLARDLHDFVDAGAPAVARVVALRAPAALAERAPRLVEQARVAQ